MDNIRLNAAIEAVVSEESARPRELASRAAGLSHRYRNESSGTAPVRWSRQDALAYAAYRLPATHAAVRAVFEEVRKRRPDWVPKSLLDVGAGPGTASWAALDTWPDMREVTLLERDAEMVRLGRRLAAHIPSALGTRAHWERGDFSSWSSSPRELTVAAYALGEVASRRLAEVTGHLWHTTSNLLVVVEPGTPAGFRTVRTVADALLLRDAHLLAPCPHDGTCPMAGGDWCHFAARLNRGSLHRRVKRGALSYEDEKFSYVCLTRSDDPHVRARVVRRPSVRRGVVTLTLCTKGGLRDELITRGDRSEYRRARKLKWGSAIVDDPPME